MVRMSTPVELADDGALSDTDWLSEARIPPEYAALPSIRDELECHLKLRHELEQRQIAAEEALAHWRTALARRWKCEVAGQRLYTQIYRQLETFYGADATYLQIINPARSGVARTTDELLADLQRIMAFCELMEPRPDFIEIRMIELAETVFQLDEALTRTSQCEELRRTAMLSHRLAQGTFRRSIQRVSSLVHSCYHDYEQNPSLRKTGD